MKKSYLSIAAVVAISIAGGTASFAAELPAYEVKGLPASPMQIGVLGAANGPGAVAGSNLDSLSASAERPDTAGETDDSDGRADPDRNRSINSLTDTSTAV